MLSNPYPAVLIGGPPHSGKSVLAYHLSQLLRQRKVDHYVVRASPDGEGNWFQEGDADSVRVLRHKGTFSQEFTDAVRHDIANRQLPLLVDGGGRPTQPQEAILNVCTHAILIAANVDDLGWWRDAAERNGLMIIAELVSTLDGEDALQQELPVLIAQIAGLKRHAPLGGTVIHAVVERLQRLFHYSPPDLRQMHFASAPVANMIEADRLGPADQNMPHSPQLSPALLADLLASTMPRVPVAVYGIGPVWLYAALAYHALPAAFYQFDPRLGWISPSTVAFGQPNESDVIAWHSQRSEQAVELTLELRLSYVNYYELNRIIAPSLPSHLGVIINGKLPLWITCGLVRAYAPCAWVAVRQPKLGEHVLVVGSNVTSVRAGDAIAGSALQRQGR